jgi:hypothetical protein
LNVHFHCVVADGVWTREGGGVRFVPLPSLTDDDVAHVLRRLEPRELLRRLATLVPPPRAHLVRYHGVFGPASKWRKEIVPESLPRACPAAVSDRSDAAPQPQPESKPSRPLDSRIPWSELLLRVFREDILVCPCGGRRKVIAFIDERPVIERILGHLGLPTTGPPPGRRRLALQDDVPELQQSLR